MSLKTTHDDSEGKHQFTSTKPPVLHASFNYYSSPTPPKLNDYSILAGTSKETSTIALPVLDLRELPAPLSSYNHEEHGFQILNQQLPLGDTSLASVHNPKVMTMQYYPAMVSLLKKELGIRATAPVNHIIRDTTPEDLKLLQDLKASKRSPPFFIAHADYSAAGSRAHLRTMTSNWACKSQSQEEREFFFKLRDEIIAAEDEAMMKVGLVPGDGDIMTGKGGHWEWDGSGYEGPRYGIFSI